MGGLDELDEKNAKDMPEQVASMLRGSLSDVEVHKSGDMNDDSWWGITRSLLLWVCDSLSGLFECCCGACGGYHGPGGSYRGSSNRRGSAQGMAMGTSWMHVGADSGYATSTGRGAYVAPTAAPNPVHGAVAQQPGVVSPQYAAGQMQPQQMQQMRVHIQQQQMQQLQAQMQQEQMQQMQQQQQQTQMQMQQPYRPALG